MPLRSPKLPRLSIRRAAPQLRPLWAPEGAPFCRVRSGRTGPRGAPLFGQRAGLAGTALPGRTTLCQSFEARKRPSVGKKGELKSAENCEDPNQFRRLGVAAARHFSGAAPANHLRFSGRPRRDDRGGTTRSGTRSEKSRDGSRRVNSLAGSALLRTEERQELGSSRTAGTDRRRIHSAPVHGILLPAGAQTSRV